MQQQRNYQQQHPQQHPQQFQNALVPHQYPPQQQQQQQQRHAQQNLLSKITNKSINSLSDLDTQLVQKSTRIASNLSSNVSGVFRKTLFNIEGSYTNMKNSVKDNVKEVVHSGLFGVGGTGGAPTSSNEASFQWEDDRRKTVVEMRRRRMGLEKHHGSTDNENRAPNPLQEYLDSEGKAEKTLKQHAVEQQVAPMDKESTIKTAFGVDEEHVKVNQQKDGDEPKIQSNDDDRIEHNNSPFSSHGPFTNSLENVHESGEMKDNQERREAIDEVDPSTFFISSNTHTTRGNGNQASKVKSNKSSSSPSKSSFSFDDDDKPSNRFGSLLRAVTPTIPKLRLPSIRRRSSGMDDSEWSDDEDYEAVRYPVTKKMSQGFMKQDKVEAHDTLQISDVLDRCSISSAVARRDTINLLTSSDMRQTSNLGKQKALFNFMTLAFGLIFLNEMRNCSLFLQNFEVLNRWIDGKQMLKSGISDVMSLDIKDVLETWAPFALIASLLSQMSISVFVQQKGRKCARNLAKTVQENVKVSQLYLRLISGSPIQLNLASEAGSLAERQFHAAIEFSNINGFTMIVLSVILATTVSVIKPIANSIISTGFGIASLPGLHEWPVDWESIGASLKDILIPLGHKVWQLLEIEMNKVVNNPMTIASTACLCIVLVAISLLPGFESKQASSSTCKASNVSLKEENKEARLMTSILNMGISSASRLELQSDDGMIQDIILKWKSLNRKLPIAVQTRNHPSNTFKKIMYLMLISVLLAAPIAVNFLHTNNAQMNYLNEFCLLVFMHGIARNAISVSLDTSKGALAVGAFMNDLRSVTKEVESTLMNNPQQDSHASATSSPTKGIVVADLWAAHVTKR